MNVISFAGLFFVGLGHSGFTFALFGLGQNFAMQLFSHGAENCFVSKPLLHRFFFLMHVGGRSRISTEKKKCPWNI